VSAELVNRLRARGIDVHETEAPDAIVELLEAVEEFEETVQAHGGDLMVDEPPNGSKAEPDDPHFLLPKRVRHEPVSKYIERLRAATDEVRRHRPHS
jgi:hypothetical protein